jgi:hypothetical protein
MAVGHGFCSKHLRRWKLYGDPLTTLRPYGQDRTLLQIGYYAVFEPSHPLAMEYGYVLEHRKVVYDAGIPVPPGHHVHHINGDKLDNRLENLEVKEAADHSRGHAEEAGVIANQFGTWPLRSSYDRCGVEGCPCIPYCRGLCQKHVRQARAAERAPTG